MSHITNVLVLGSSLECSAERLAQINTHFRDRPGFVLLEDSYEDHRLGGDRVWCPALFLGSFNYLDVDELLAHLRSSVPWELPDQVQILVGCEGEDFAVHRLRVSPATLEETLREVTRQRDDLLVRLLEAQRKIVP